MKISAKLGFAFLVAVISPLIIGFVYHHNLDRLSTTRQWVEHTYQVLGRLDSLSESISRLEGCARGFCVAADPTFLSDYNTYKVKPLVELDEIRKLTADNPTQTSYCAELAPIIDKKISFNDLVIEARRKDFQGSANLIQQKTGLKLREDIDHIVQKMKFEEQRLLNTRTTSAIQLVEMTEKSSLYGSMAAVLLIGVIGYLVGRAISSKITALQQNAIQVGQGNFAVRTVLPGNDEINVLADAFNEMTSKLQAQDTAARQENWIKDKFTDLTARLQQYRTLESLGAGFIETLAEAIEAQQGTIYRVHLDANKKDLHLIGAYACDPNTLQKSIDFGEGLLGQVAQTGVAKHFKELDSENKVITSTLLRSKKLGLIVQPIFFGTELKGIIEVASVQGFSEQVEKLMANLAPWLGSIMNSIELNLATESLLRDTQTMNEELQAQQEELEVQQEELRQTNEELEQKSDELEEQNNAIAEQNRTLDKLHFELRDKHSELTLASKYKSEFMANMSHDLRTPLNSMLIFADILAENSDNNLTEEQVEFAKSIRSSGNSLLGLINDVLDLSKIEAGKLSIEPERIDVHTLVATLRSNFTTEAHNKSLFFKVEVTDDAPDAFESDEKRISQILNNLLSNAFKFTKEGGITLAVSPVLIESVPFIKFSVSDTGIGIAPEKHQMVFEPFQQAEPKILSEYGGTGLGLSICRELTALLGGKIELRSAPGKGSEFTLFLPISGPPASSENRYDGGNGNKIDLNAVAKQLEQAEPAQSSSKASEAPGIFVPDDRDNIDAHDKVLLIIEDDATFAKILLDTARKNGFKSVVAGTGKTGFELACQLKPDGITLDLHLPDTDGWVVLDRLKTTAETRHIPVHIITVDSERMRALTGGAMGYLEKPTQLESLSQAIKKLKDQESRKNSVLLVEADDSKAKQCIDLLLEEGQDLLLAASAKEAMEVMRSKRFDCVVVGAGLPDMPLFDFIETAQKLDQMREVPVLVYSGNELATTEHGRLKELGKTGIVKDIESLERLLLEASLFLHRVETNLPLHKRTMIQKALSADSNLNGRKILVVDDDARNQMALKALLSRLDMDLIFANNGKESLKQLLDNPDVDLVLMDMMMPEMDGYEAMTEIRKNERFKDLPMIAVTAKAMKDDRRKCMEAGASDYISKPVDKNQLLSLLRVWLAKR